MSFNEAAANRCGIRKGKPASVGVMAAGFNEAAANRCGIPSRSDASQSATYSFNEAAANRCGIPRLRIACHSP